MAVALLRQLQGDFRAVEESFRQIALQVQRRQAEDDASRGRILEYALDAEDVLRRDDQGISFFEFVRLVLSPTETERLEKIVREVRRIPELSAQQEGLEGIRGMTALLQAEADKVMRTNQSLSATLRRLLDNRAQAERQRLARVIRDIRVSATALAQNPPSHIALDVEVSLELESPFRQRFWQQPARFESQPMQLNAVDDQLRQEAFKRLAALARLDWKEFRSRIRRITTKGPATLRDLVDAYPAQTGVVEALAYLQIARDDGHVVDPVQTQDILIAPFGRKPLLLVAPLITFAQPH